MLHRFLHVVDYLGKLPPGTDLKKAAIVLFTDLLGPGRCMEWGGWLEVTEMVGLPPEFSSVEFVCCEAGNHEYLMVLRFIVRDVYARDENGDLPAIPDDGGCLVFFRRFAEALRDGTEDVCGWEQVDVPAGGRKLIFYRFVGEESWVLSGKMPIVMKPMLDLFLCLHACRRHSPPGFFDHISPATPPLGPAATMYRNSGLFFEYT